MPDYHLHRGDAPLIVSLPHDGTAVPEDIAARMTDIGRAVPDTDWWVSRLYGFARQLGVTEDAVKVRARQRHAVHA